MSSLSIAVQLGIATVVTSLGIRDSHSRARIPGLTLLVAAALVACLVLQLRDPALLPLVMRDADLVGLGQYYRLATAIWFQDGGALAGLLNLMLFLPVGWIAEAALGRPAWCGAYASGALAGGLAAIWWQPIGAGNSIATLGLAGCLLARYAARAASPGARAMSAIALGAALLLAFLHDIHGVATLAGAAFGLVHLNTVVPEE